jgi:RNA polymerase-binding transcription factor DksA
MEISKFKKKLETELALVEKELNEVARKNPDNPKDWEPVETEMDSDHADDNDVADNLESFEENTGILNRLETKYNDIKDALVKIKKGTYGKCEVGGEDIPIARLEANPSARTCMKHFKKK